MLLLRRRVQIPQDQQIALLKLGDRHKIKCLSQGDLHAAGVLGQGGQQILGEVFLFQQGLPGFVGIEDLAGVQKNDGLREAAILFAQAVCEKIHSVNSLEMKGKWKDNKTRGARTFVCSF